MKVVIDANIFVSSLIAPETPPAEVFIRWQAHAFDLIMSLAMFDEWLDVVDRPETRRFFRRSPDWIATILAEIQSSASFVEPVAVVVVADDPDDDVILGTAIAGDADYIVTGDKHLLAIGAYQGIQIVTPRRFLDVLDLADLLP